MRCLIGHKVTHLLKSDQIVFFETVLLYLQIVIIIVDFFDFDMETNKRNDVSNSFVKLLREYYDREGIYPERLDEERFRCIRKDQCPDLEDTKLARGMQCYVGYKYGETIKIVVSALDCGGGGADVIEDRTSDIIETHNNPHMRGTLRAVSLILGKPTDEESLYFFAMINACKCCNKDKTDHLSTKYYENCSVHKLEEYRILKPDVILFQGKEDLSLAGCWQYLSEIDDPELDSGLKKYLRKYSDGIIDCFALICIHPSARGRSFVKRQKFYDDIFPRIAEYLRKKLMEHKEQE